VGREGGNGPCPTCSSGTRSEITTVGGKCSTPLAERPPGAAERVFRNAEDPLEVVVLFEWDSLESTRRRIDSATLSRKFDEAGVSGGIAQTEFYLLEEEAEPAE
jgi:hypothetical protein